MFTIGLAKKVLLADTIAPYADAGFATPHDLQWLAAWGTSLAYALQLYFDFSGYSDMAIGLGLMFGFVFAKNFDSCAPMCELCTCLRIRLCCRFECGLVVAADRVREGDEFGPEGQTAVTRAVGDRREVCGVSFLSAAPTEHAGVRRRSKEAFPDERQPPGDQLHLRARECAAGPRRVVHLSVAHVLRGSELPQVVPLAG